MGDVLRELPKEKAETIMEATREGYDLAIVDTRSLSGSTAEKIEQLDSSDEFPVATDDVISEALSEADVLCRKRFNEMTELEKQKYLGTEPDGIIWKLTNIFSGKDPDWDKPTTVFIVPPELQEHSS
jgi:hypothetical protein